MTPPEERPHPSDPALLFSSIEDELEEVESLLLAELATSDPIIEQLVDYTSHWRGKRLRPALLLLSGSVYGPLIHDHKVLAAVLEMIHTATLVHDDVLDAASLRRHNATIHSRWDTATSVLFGDFLFTHAFHLASSLESTFACHMIGKATNRVCGGELRQIHQQGNYDLTESEYLEIISSKTAELCAVSCLLGVYCSGASQSIQAAFEDYGRNLGIAFQITDDLLDYVGEENEVGKSLGTDLDQNKLTLPLIALLQSSETGFKNEANQLLASSDHQKRLRLSQLLKDSNALEYSQQRALEFADKACLALSEIPESPTKNTLLALTQLAVTRKA